MGAVSASGGGRPPRDLAGTPVGTGMDLMHVMVLPEGNDDGAWAVQQLERALETPDILFMLVLGDDERAAQIVGWAASLCIGTGAPGGGLERRVFWIRDPGRSAVGVFLAMLLWLPLPRVAVLNSREWVRVRIAEHEEIDAEVLEQAFRRG